MSKRKKVFNSVQLFKKRGHFRLALVYANRENAATAFADAKGKIPSDAYMVSLDTWCPKKVDAKSNFVDCSE